MNHGCPHGAFRNRDSCPLAKGTATSTISSRVLCSNTPSGSDRLRNPAPSAAFTVQSFIFFAGSHMDLSSMNQKTVNTVNNEMSVHALRHAHRRGARRLLERDCQDRNAAEICALRRLGLRGKSVSSMREYLGALVVVKRELSGVGPCRAEIITGHPFCAYAVRLRVSPAEKHIHSPYKVL